MKKLKLVICLLLMSPALSSWMGLTASAQNTAPNLKEPIPDQQALEDHNFNYQFPESTFNDPEDDILTYTATMQNGLPLPAWLSFDASTRTFFGSPIIHDIGTVLVRVTASDGPLSVYDDFTITVIEFNDPPYFNPSLGGSLTVSTGTQGVVYSHNFGAKPFLDEEDGPGMTYTVTYPDDTPVDWLSIISTNLGLTGTPDQKDTGTITYKLTTTDSGNKSISVLFDITVADVNVKPTIVNQIPNQTADAGSYFEYSIPSNVFEDPDGDPLTYSILLGTASAWATFDPITFKISGTPPSTSAGTASISFRAFDGGTEGFGNAQFEIEVLPAIIWNGSNWIPSTTPTSADNVILFSGTYNTSLHGSLVCKNLTINSGRTLTVDGNAIVTVNGGITNNGSLIVESGSSLITYEGNTVTGNRAIIQRNTRYSDGRYSFVGSPVTQISDVRVSDIGSNVYTYDESMSALTDDLSRWLAAGPTDQLVPGRGYTQANQQLIEFVGVPNTGTITYAGSYANDGWHLVANPYSAAIFIDDFLDANTNTTGAVYIWDDNGSDTGRGSNSDYIVANKIGATDTNGPDNQSRFNDHIGSAQGFFVQLASTSGAITFTESMRVSGNNGDDNFFRKTENDIPTIRINLTNDQGLFKQTIAGQVVGISDEKLASGFDALLFNANSDYAVYSRKAGQKLAIQGFSSQKEEIPLGMNLAEAGNYSLEVGSKGFGSESVYLRDHLTGETISLTNEAYAFSASEGQTEDRFSLLVTSSVLAVHEQKSGIYAYDKVLHIRSSDSFSKTFLLYNLSGSLVLKTSVSDSNEIDLSYLPNGIYLVSDGIETKKIILK
ncbi:MAG: putative Ig domain-containing protein [Cyclobacteriaceae bacterium]